MKLKEKSFSWITTWLSFLTGTVLWLSLDESLNVPLWPEVFRTPALHARTIQDRAHEIYDRLGVFAQNDPKHTLILAIDDESMNQLGKWPWHRDAVARLVDRALQQEPKAIGFDLVFSESDTRVPASLREELTKLTPSLDVGRFETDQKLSSLLSFFSNKLVLGLAGDGLCLGPLCAEQSTPSRLPLGKSSKLKVDRAPIVQQPQGNLTSFAQTDEAGGFLLSSPDSDGVTRKIPMFLNAVAPRDDKLKTYHSLSMVLLEKTLGPGYRLENDSEGYPFFLRWPAHQVEIPLNKQGEIRPRFMGSAGTIPHLKASELMSGREKVRFEQRGRIHENRLTSLMRDKAIIFGITATGLSDAKAFPLDADAPGVEGHATAVESVLNRSVYKSWRHLGLSSIWAVSALAIIALMMHLTISTFPMFQAFTVFGATILGTQALDAFLISQMVAIPTLVIQWVTITSFGTLALVRYFREESTKKFIQGAFIRYLSPKVVNQLVANASSLNLEGEKKHLAILFSDIHGFSKYSETMASHVLVKLLNEYLGWMTKHVKENQGTLDKYIGDALMAFYGAPVSLLRPEEHALKSALDMLVSVEQLKPVFMSKYGVELKIGIGVHSGSIHVGNLGSESVFSYTVIGESVNFASRIENLTKTYGVTLLTSEFVMNKLSEGYKSQIGFRMIDEVIVEGNPEPVRLYEIRSAKFDPAFLTAYNTARNYYIVGKFNEALPLFEELSAHDNVSKIFMERCKTIPLSRSQKEEWTGIWIMNSK